MRTHLVDLPHPGERSLCGGRHMAGSPEKLMDEARNRLHRISWVLQGVWTISQFFRPWVVEY